MGGCQSKKSIDATAMGAKAVTIDDNRPEVMSPTPRVLSPNSSADGSPMSINTEEARRAALSIIVQNASLALTKVARGFLARQRVDHLRRACSSYRVNMKAETFGHCFCGWVRSAHTAAALAPRCERIEAKKVKSPELRAKFFQRELASCTRYEVDLVAATVGQCKCGRARAEHSAAALAKSDDKGKSNEVVDAEKLRATFVQREKTTCEMFVVNMTTGRFGECMCGKLRADHTAAALAAGEAKSSAAHPTELVMSPELRKKFLQKQTVECKHFVVSMNASRFGECKCGKLRAEHSALAVSSKVKSSNATIDSDTLHRKFTQCELVECEQYAVDMLTPGVPFGQCLCGEPKRKHSAEALQPRRRSAKEDSLPEAPMVTAMPQPTGEEIPPTNGKEMNDSVIHV